MVNAINSTLAADHICCPHWKDTSTLILVSKIITLEPPQVYIIVLSPEHVPSVALSYEEHREGPM